MPFCPKCRFEYRPDISKCPDCDEFLVPVLPQEKDDISENEEYEKYDWVPLARLTSTSLADLVSEALQSKDIPVIVLSGTGHFGMTGQMGPSSFRPIDGGLTIMVPREMALDADREAEIILGEDWQKSRLIDINEFPDDS